jgi:hypothetical protein
MKGLRELRSLSVHRLDHLPRLFFRGSLYFVITLFYCLGMGPLCQLTSWLGGLAKCHPAWSGGVR